MVGLQVEQQLYFWLITTLQLPDDSKNEINFDNNSVILFREYSQKIENGVYIGQLMHNIRKIMIRKTKNPFSLDQQLINLKDNSTKAVKETNWTLCVKELKKFDIVVSKEQKQDIVNNSDPDHLNEILRKLMDYEGSIQSHDINQGAPTAAPAGLEPKVPTYQSIQSSEERNQSFDDQIQFDKNNHLKIDQNRYGISKQSANKSNQKQKNNRKEQRSLSPDRSNQESYSLKKQKDKFKSNQNINDNNDGYLAQIDLSSQNQIDGESYGKKKHNSYLYKSDQDDFQYDPDEFDSQREAVEQYRSKEYEVNQNFDELAGRLNNGLEQHQASINNHGDERYDEDGFENYQGVVMGDANDGYAEQNVITKDHPIEHFNDGYGGPTQQQQRVAPAKFADDNYNNSHIDDDGFVAATKQHLSGSGASQLAEAKKQTAGQPKNQPERKSGQKLKKSFENAKKQSYDMQNRRKHNDQLNANALNVQLNEQYQYPSDANTNNMENNNSALNVGFGPVPSQQSIQQYSSDFNTQLAQNNIRLNEINYTSEFIFLTLQDQLQVNLVTVEGLLKDNHHLFLIACKNGLKNKDYSKILQWLQLLSSNEYVDKLINLLYKENEVCNTFDVLKCGLYSKNNLVQNQAITLFLLIGQRLKENNLEGVQALYYQWLVLDRVQVAPKEAKSKSRSPAPKPPKSPIKEKAQKKNTFCFDRGLKSFIIGLDKENKKYDKKFTQFLEIIGKHDYMYLLNNHLRSVCINQLQYNEYKSLITDIQMSNNPQLLIDTGVLKLWIEEAINKTEDNNNEIKIQSMTFLVNLWSEHSLYVQGKTDEGFYAELIMQILKKQCRSPSLMVSIFSINSQFMLLDKFTQAQNVFAPKIYKALTFLLIDSFFNLDIRNEIINNFIKLFNQNPTIPIKILCEPYFKTIFINQEKHQKQTNNNTNFLMPTSEYFVLNTTDFEFFIKIAVHPKLTKDVAMQLMDIVNEVTLTNLTYVRISLNILMTIINRFKNDNAIIEKCKQQIADNLAKIQSQDVKKVDMFLKCNKERLRSKAIKAKRIQKKGPKVLNLRSSLSPKKIIERASADKLPNFNFSMKKKDFDHSETEPSVLPGSSLIGEEKEEYLTDKEIYQALDVKLFPDENNKFNNMIMNERMMVNQIQCFLNTGIQRIMEYSKKQIRDAFIKTEREQVFKNNGLLYLLKHYDKRVEQVFNDFNNEKTVKRQEKERKRKEAYELQRAQQQQQQLAVDEEFAKYQQNMQAYNKGVKFDLTPQARSENVNNNKLKKRYKYSQQLDDSLNNREVAQFQAVPSRQKNKLSLSTINHQNPILKNPLAKGAVQNNYGLDFQSNNNSEIGRRGASGSRRTLQQNRKSLDNALNKERIYKSFNPKRIETVDYQKTHHGMKDLLNVEELMDSEIQFYLTWLKYYSRVYKALFKNYAKIQNSKANLKNGQFDGLQQKMSMMDISEVYMLLNDYKLNDDAFKKKLNHHEIAKLIKAINVKEKHNVGQNRTHSELDIQGFIEFMLQVGYYMYDCVKSPSWFMPKLFNRMKQAAQKQDRPLFQGLLADPHISSFGDKDLLHELNKQANIDPYSFQLPDGFTLNKSVALNENVYKDEAELICKELVNDICVQSLGINSFVPFKDQWVVKKDEKELEKLKAVRPQYFDIYSKKKDVSAGEGEDQTTDTSVRQPSKNNYNTKFEKFRAINQKRIQKSRAQSNGNSRSKSPGRKQPVMKMISTIPPKLDINIKMQLALNKNIDKDVAYLLDDMIRAVEVGRTTLTPRAQQRTNDAIRAGEQWRARGQMRQITIKQEKEKQWKEDQKLKEKQRLERQQEQKEQLRKAKIEASKQIELARKQQEIEAKRKFEDELKKEKMKKNFYDSIKRDYHEQRQQQLEQLEEKKQREAEAEQLRKKQNLEKQKEFTQKNQQQLKELFEQKSKQRFLEMQKNELRKQQESEQVYKRNQKLLEERKKKLETLDSARNMDIANNGAGYSGGRNQEGRSQAEKTSASNPGLRKQATTVKGGGVNGRDHQAGGLKQSNSVVGLQNNLSSIPGINLRSSVNHNKNQSLQQSQSYVQGKDLQNNFQINLQNVNKYGPNEVPASLNQSQTQEKEADTTLPQLNNNKNYQTNDVTAKRQKSFFSIFSNK